MLQTVRSSGQMTYSGIHGGFCSGSSTLTNVLTLHHLIESDAGSHIFFLDFASTFDSVNWPIPCEDLQKQGMNQLVLQLIYRLMYQDMSFSLIVSGIPITSNTTYIWASTRLLLISHPVQQIYG